MENDISTCDQVSSVMRCFGRIFRRICLSMNFSVSFLARHRCSPFDGGCPISVNFEVGLILLKINFEILDQMCVLSARCEVVELGCDVEKGAHVWTAAMRYRITPTMSSASDSNSVASNWLHDAWRKIEDG